MPNWHNISHQRTEMVHNWQHICRMKMVINTQNIKLLCYVTIYCLKTTEEGKQFHERQTCVFNDMSRWYMWIKAHVMWPLFYNLCVFVLKSEFNNGIVKHCITMYTKTVFNIDCKTLSAVCKDINKIPAWEQTCFIFKWLTRKLKLIVNTLSLFNLTYLHKIILISHLTWYNHDNSI